MHPVITIRQFIGSKPSREKAKEELRQIKENKVKEQEKKAKEKQEKEDRRKSEPIPKFDYNHPPGARDVGFRKSFALSGRWKSGDGNDSGRNSPTTMANTAANATIKAMNSQAKPGDKLEVPKGGQGKMRTVDQYGDTYDSVSPRTHTNDPSTRKISEDLDLTAPPSAAAAVQPNVGSVDQSNEASTAPPVQPNVGSVDRSNQATAAATEEEAGGILEPMPTLIDSALAPNLPTISEPTQTHILPEQDPDFLTTSKLSPRPNALQQKRNTHTSSIYSENINDLSQVTTNRSDTYAPIDNVTTNESDYTQDDRHVSNEFNEEKKPRPTTLQQEYTTLVDLPLTPLPTHTNFSENEKQLNAPVDAQPEDTEDDVELTPKAKQGEFPAPSGVDSQQAREEENTTSKPGDFIAAIQNTFPDSALNTAPERVSPKAFTPDATGSSKDSEEQNYTFGGGQSGPSEHDSGPQHPSNTTSAVNGVDLSAPDTNNKETEDAYLKLTQTPPVEGNIESQPENTIQSAPKGTVDRIKVEEHVPRSLPNGPIDSKTDFHRPNLVERDTSELIRQTPGGFIETPVDEKVPDIVGS